jgi:hypothetical protein
MFTGLIFFLATGRSTAFSYRRGNRTVQEKHVQIMMGTCQKPPKQKPKKRSNLAIGEK